MKTKIITNENKKQGKKRIYSKDESSRLEHFTISFLAILLGFVGFTLAYFKAEHVLGFPIHLAHYLLDLTLILMLIVFIILFLKLIFYPGAILKEIRHPIKLNFFQYLQSYS